jgi:hypothetical protein
MYVDAIISKIYAKEIYDMFKADNFRNVSVEMQTADEETLSNGDIPINGLNIVGITILGKNVNGSCPNANMTIVQFSADKAEEYYKTSQPTLKQLAEERTDKLKLVSHPIDKSKRAVDMGDWNGDKAKNDLIKEKKFKILAKSVCLLLEDGWEDRKKGSLKYPVMNLKNGKWVYNAEGLSSARGYGEQHDPNVADKAISIQKRLGLYKDNDKEEHMEEKKLAKSESKDTEKDVVMDEQPKDDEKEMSCENKEMGCDKEMSNAEDKDKEMGCDKTMSDEESKGDDNKDKDEEKNDNEKKFSLDAYVDQVAMLAMLENETEQNKELADKVMKQMSADEIVKQFIQMSKENADLKAEKEANDKEKRDKKFSAIMASVKEDLDVKTFSELSEEGKDLALEQLGAFENKVKAFAYEATKLYPRKEDDGIMRFAGIEEQNQNNGDVFDRLSKM